MTMIIFLYKSVVRNISKCKTFYDPFFCIRMAKVGCAIALGVGSCLGLSLPALSQSETLTEEQLFQLCSRYQYNSQCEGYEAPVSLDGRDGMQGRCQLETEGELIEDNCKVETSGETIDIYLEVGDGLSLLEGERKTTEINVALETISRLSYSEGTRISRTLEVANALSLFGQVLQIAGGGSVVPSTQISTRVPAAKVDIQLGSANLLSVDYDRLIFEGDIRQGIELRDEIRRLTGLSVYYPLPEESIDPQEADFQEVEEVDERASSEEAVDSENSRESQ